MPELQELWGQVVSYFTSLSQAGLMLHAAGGLFILIVLYSLLPSGNKKEENQAGAKGGKKSSISYKSTSKARGKTKIEPTLTRAELQEQSGRDYEESFKKAAKEQKKREHSLCWWRRPKPLDPQTVEAVKLANSDKESVNNKLDFLRISRQRPDCDEFKHGKVDDSYKELVIAKPTDYLNYPDVEEIDKVFRVMLNAGAVRPRKHLVTNYEHQYLEKLRMWFGERFFIYCQVSVGSMVIIDSDVSDLPMVKRHQFAQKCHNMSFDFVLIDRLSDAVVCAIELDDPTHKEATRIFRDRRLDHVCLAAKIPLFHITDINQKPDLRKIAPHYDI